MVARIDLIPRSVQEQRRKRTLVVYMVMFSLLILGLLGDNYLTMRDRVNFQKDQLTHVENNINQYSHLLDEKKQYDEINADIDFLGKVIHEIHDNSHMIYIQMEEILRLIPTDIRLLSLRYTGDNLIITGLTTGNRPVSELMIILDDRPYIEEVSLKGIYYNSSTDRYGYNFEVQGTIRDIEGDN